MKKILSLLIIIVVSLNVCACSFRNDDYYVEPANTENTEFDEYVVDAVHAGDRIMFLSNKGILYRWGMDNGTSTTGRPVVVDDDVVSFDVSGTHAAVISSDNSLSVWGDNQYGELGKGDTSTYIYDTSPDKLMDGVKKTNIDYGVTSAITTDGSVFIWGYACGSPWSKDCGIDDYTIPTKVMSNMVDAAIGANANCFVLAAIDESGDLYLLCNSDRYDCTTPTKYLSGIKSVVVNDLTVAAITENNELYLCDPFNDILEGDTLDSSGFCTFRKVVSDVKLARISSGVIAVITENNDLYINLDQPENLAHNEWDGLRFVMSDVAKVSVAGDAYLVLDSNHKLYVRGGTCVYGTSVEGVSEYHDSLKELDLMGLYLGRYD